MLQRAGSMQSAMGGPSRFPQKWRKSHDSADNHIEKATDQLDSTKGSAEARRKSIQRILQTDVEAHGLCQVLCDKTSETGHWVDSNQFKVIICCVVILNAGYVGVTALEEEDAETAGWDVKTLTFFIIECCFLSVFTLELTLRFRARGLCDFVRDAWNYFDFGFVVANFLEVVTAVLQFSQVGNLTAAAAILRVLRVVRLMRVFQIVRLFRFVDELQLLLKGMLSAVRTLVWSMGMLFTLIYVVALLLTKYLGHVTDLEETRYYFGTLPRSMFTLFTFVTLEGWPDTARHLMDREPWGGFLVIVIMIFILFSNLALLNLVTAVLVESVVGIANADDKKRMERFEKERRETVKKLASVFGAMDKDGDGELCLAEFQAGVTGNKEIRQMMYQLSIDANDAEELFHIIDFDGDEKITAMEFIEGAMMCKAGDVMSRHMLGFHYDMRKYFHVMGKAQDEMMQLLVGHGSTAGGEGTCTVSNSVSEFMRDVGRGRVRRNTRLRTPLTGGDATSSSPRTGSTKGRLKNAFIKAQGVAALKVPDIPKSITPKAGSESMSSEALSHKSNGDMDGEVSPLSVDAGTSSPSKSGALKFMHAIEEFTEPPDSPDRHMRTVNVDATANVGSSEAVRCGWEEGEQGAVDSTPVEPVTPTAKETPLQASRPVQQFQFPTQACSPRSPVSRQPSPENMSRQPSGESEDPLARVVESSLSRHLESALAPALEKALSKGLEARISAEMQAMERRLADAQRQAAEEVERRLAGQLQSNRSAPTDLADGSQVQEGRDSAVRPASCSSNLAERESLSCIVREAVAQEITSALAGLKAEVLAASAAEAAVVAAPPATLPAPPSAVSPRPPDRSRHGSGESSLDPPAGPIPEQNGAGRQEDWAAPPQPPEEPPLLPWSPPFASAPAGSPAPLAATLDRHAPEPTLLPVTDLADVNEAKVVFPLAAATPAAVPDMSDLRKVVSVRVVANRRQNPR